MPAPATPWEARVDRAARACERVFGEVERVLITPVVGAAFYLPEIPGQPAPIFEASTAEIDPETGASVMVYKPTLALRMSQLPAAPVNGWRAFVRGVLYEMHTPMFDGQGTVTVRLRRMT